jgi:hypothetical protein
MVMSGQLHAPTSLPPGKRTLITIARESGSAPKADLDDMEKRGVSSVCREWNPDSSVFRLIAWSLYQLSFPGSQIYVCA